MKGDCTGKRPHAEISRVRSTPARPIIAIHNIRSAHSQTNDMARGVIATGKRDGWLGNEKSHMEGESNSLNTPSLLDFQSDAGEYDLMMVTKCPTSGYGLSSMQVPRYMSTCFRSQGTAGSGARLVFSTYRVEHRQTLPLQSSDVQLKIAPLSLIPGI